MDLKELNPVCFAAGVYLQNICWPSSCMLSNFSTIEASIFAFGMKDRKTMADPGQGHWTYDSIDTCRVSQWEPIFGLLWTTIG